MEKTKTSEVKVMDCFEFQCEVMSGKGLYIDFMAVDKYPKNMTDEQEEQIMTDIWEANSGDPDYLICGGEKVAFFDYDFDNVKYIIMIADGDQIEDRDKVEKMLKDFYLDNYTEYYVNDPKVRTWDDFHALENGIAYRGGCGYAYTLHTYIKE